MNKCLSKEDIQTANKHMKNCWSSWNSMMNEGGRQHGKSEDPELASSYRYINTEITYRVTMPENNTNTSGKGFPQPRIKSTRYTGKVGGVEVKYDWGPQRSGSSTWWKEQGGHGGPPWGARASNRMLGSPACICRERMRHCNSWLWKPARLTLVEPQVCRKQKFCSKRGCTRTYFLQFLAQRQQPKSHLENHWLI